MDEREIGPIGQWEYIDRSQAYTTVSGMITISTWRLKVPGGWVYKITEWNNESQMEKPEYTPRYDILVCFVPE